MAGAIPGETMPSTRNTANRSPLSTARQKLDLSTFVIDLAAEGIRGMGARCL